MIDILSSMNLGEYVKNRRAELRISQRELAKVSGLSYTYIASLELGINPSTGKPISPTVETLQKLSKGLQIPYERLSDIARGLDPDRLSAKYPLGDDRREWLEAYEALSPEEQKMFMKMVRRAREEGK